MKNSLDSGIKLVKNVGRYNIGPFALRELEALLKNLRMKAKSNNESERIVFLVDIFFKRDVTIKSKLFIGSDDILIFVDSADEPTTNGIDQIVCDLLSSKNSNPAAIVGMGGGTTMDTAKAVSNLLTNGGKAHEYQGWDLLKRPGIFKIGIPTVSGTGAEATRTCVMTNPVNKLKLGMNSDHTVFDHVIMDPMLTLSVPREQYFYSGMDAYIHCIESLHGSHRNAIGDAFSRETLNLCRQIFLSEDMTDIENREKMMVASYLGGCAIATSYVGLVHPMSAGLSVVLGIHHCLANCIVMQSMDEYYPEAHKEFVAMSIKQNIKIPTGICSNLTENDFISLYSAVIIHEKPLNNALGVDFKSILSFEKAVELFKKM
jgi:3-deoxy-alpha-D-manno-octulosonate 8-oxidase